MNKNVFHEYMNPTKVLSRFSMMASKKGSLSTSHGTVLSRSQCPTTAAETERMKDILYASAVAYMIDHVCHAMHTPGRVICFEHDVEISGKSR